MKLLPVSALILMTACGGSLPAQSVASLSLNEGLTLAPSPTTDSYLLSQWGRAERTYFIQHSEDLHTWSYLRS